MFSLEVPADATLESLLTEVVPALHARCVGADAPTDVFTITVRIEGRGGWTARIRGREMTVVEGEAARPTLWMHSSERAAERFLQNARAPRRSGPGFAAAGGVATLSDPRVLKRVAMASGRVELALYDEDGERLAVTFGFGHAARKDIDPENADVVLETRREALERVLRGELGPEEALADGQVTLRGNRFLAVQLALAVAPFFPRRK
jgi:putative sterol carrier protein